MPPTILTNADKDERYKNLAPFINKTTQFLVYGDLSVKNLFYHIKHCENINIVPNVTIVKMKKLSVKALRDSGELFNIINSILK